MKKYFKKYFSLFIVVLLALIFFVTTSSLNYFTQDSNYVKWASPDETANYYFSKEFSERKQLSVFDPAAVVGDNMVIPRSLRSDFGWVKPVSFLGIILIYGEIGSILGIAVIPFLTPFFAALGVIMFYFLIKNIFNEKLALFSAFLLATFPVYIYYSARSMFHNVLFIFFLICSFYFFGLANSEKIENIKNKFLSFKFKKIEIKNFIFSFFGGAFFGLAIITRTSELLWLAPIMFLIWLFYVKRVGFMKLVISLAGCFLALLPVIYFNQILYSSPIYGGYNAMNQSLDDLSRTGGEIIKSISNGTWEKFESYASSIYNNIFYFGFKPGQSIDMFGHYVISMFPILFYASLLGLLFLIVKNCIKFEKKYLVYFLAWVVLSVILVFYYGSWKFNDNPDPSSYTIGNSYTRYWLPIYLMMMPLVSLAIIRISRAVFLISSKTKNRARKIASDGLQYFIILFVSFSSIIFVLYGSEEGLAYLYYNNLFEKNNTQRVFSLTEPEAIIITKYYDKFFFPERRVVMGTIPDDEVLISAEKLIKYYPVYYYNFYLNQADLDYLNSRKLDKYNLRMELVKKMNAKFGLYKLIDIENEKK